MFKQKFEENFKGLLREQEHVHFGFSTTTWLMSSRSSSELKGLQTTWAHFLDCYQDVEDLSGAVLHQYAKGV